LVIVESILVILNILIVQWSLWTI